MKHIALAAAIIACLMMLPSSFIPEQDYPPASSGFEIYPCMMCPPLFPCWYPCMCPPPLMIWPTTSDEPKSLAVTPTPSPSPAGHVPVTISYMGNVGDLSFIYEGGKIAYVQFYSKEEDRMIRITYENYKKLACMGKIPYYGTLTQCDKGHAMQGADHRQGTQEKTAGVNEYIASVRGMARSLRDYTQGMINKVRTAVT